MILRLCEKNLREWKNRKIRRPLILRGARQTGKTTLIRYWGKKNFKHLIELNLDLAQDIVLIEKSNDVDELIRALEIRENIIICAEEALIFIDEIQNSPKAVQFLRYFYEMHPQLHVIAAGSLLEVRLKEKGFSFPVGRIEFLYLYPLNFHEYLYAAQKDILIQELKKGLIKLSLPEVVRMQAQDYFFDYLCIGGMPACVQAYLETSSELSVKKIQSGLFLTIMEDFTKYSTEAQVKNLRVVWQNWPFILGQRINYSKFGGETHYSKDIAKAIDVLEDAMLLKRILPTISTEMPLIPKKKFAPKIIGLDIAIGLNSVGVEKQALKNQWINSMFSGGIFEAFIGQELLALSNEERSEMCFWVRQEKGASSELDYLVKSGKHIIPIEVKSGKTGTLKSLHQFMHRSRSNLAFRFYNGPLKTEKVSYKIDAKQKVEYELISIPLFLISFLDTLVESLF